MVGSFLTSYADEDEEKLPICVKTRILFSFKESRAFILKDLCFFSQRSGFFIYKKIQTFFKDPGFF